MDPRWGRVIQTLPSPLLPRPLGRVWEPNYTYCTRMSEGKRAIKQLYSGLFALSSFFIFRHWVMLETRCTGVVIFRRTLLHSAPLASFPGPAQLSPPFMIQNGKDGRSLGTRLRTQLLPSGSKATPHKHYKLTLPIYFRRT